MEKLTKFFAKIATTKIVMIALIVSAGWNLIMLLVNFVDWIKYIVDSIDYGYFSAAYAIKSFFGMTGQVLVIAALAIIVLCMIKNINNILPFIAIAVFAGVKLLGVFGSFSVSTVWLAFRSFIGILELVPWVVILAFAFMLYLPKVVKFLNGVKKYCVLAGLISAAILIVYSLLDLLVSFVYLIQNLVDWGVEAFSFMGGSIFVSLISIVTVVVPQALYAIYLGIKNQEVVVKEEEVVVEE